MGLAPLHEIVALREAYEGRVTIEIVTFPQAGVVPCPGVIDLMDAAVDAGTDLVGGIDPSVIDDWK
jgi:cytosine deaminase